MCSGPRATAKRRIPSMYLPAVNAEPCFERSQPNPRRHCETVTLGDGDGAGSLSSGPARCACARSRAVGTTMARSCPSLNPPRPPVGPAGEGGYHWSSSMRGARSPHPFGPRRHPASGCALPESGALGLQGWGVGQQLLRGDTGPSPRPCASALAGYRAEAHPSHRPLGQREHAGSDRQGRRSKARTGGLFNRRRGRTPRRYL